MRARKALVLSLLLVTAGGMSLSAGCSSSNKGDMAAMDHAMYCPKCERVWVNERTSDNPRIVTYGSKRAMVCPDCDAQAAAALTGEGETMLHDCEMCKVKPMMVEREFRPVPSNRK